MKKWYILMFAVANTLTGFSQEPAVKGQNQQAEERRANAGKADVITTKKRIIFDSTTITDNSTEAVRKKSSTTPGKRKNCRKKS